MSVRLGTYARHYYDLFQLASRPEILEMLQSAEYGEIKQDYDRISRTYFPGSYFYPDQMSFVNSDALFASHSPSAAYGTAGKIQRPEIGSRASASSRLTRTNRPQRFTTECQ
jgi:hypothetical protein